MRVGSVLKAATAAAAALTVALIAVAKSIDANKYKDFLAAQVLAATGRELVISGPLKLKLGLSPSVTISGVSLANAPWGQRQPMISVERIEAQVALIPLLSREIRVKRLLLINPALRLETDAEGRGNWQLAAKPADDVGRPRDGGPATRFEVAEVRVEKAAFSLRDGRTASTTTLAVDRLKIQPENNGDGPLSLSLAGTYNNTGFELGGVVGSLSALVSGKPYSLQLKGSVGGAVLVAAGTVADPFAFKGVDIKLGAQGDELAEVLKPFDTALPPVGPFKLSARLTDAAGHPSLSEIDAAVGKRDALMVAAKGEIRDAVQLGRRAAGIELALTLDSDNLAGLSRLTGAEVPPLGPLKLTGKLTDLTHGWRLADIKGTLGTSDVAGELALMLEGRPRLSGHLASTSLALADFRPVPRRPVPQSAGDGRLFSADPLPLEGVRAFDADLSLSAARLALGGAAFTDVGAELRLDRGRLAVKPLSAVLAGGRLQGDLGLDASGRAAVLTARLGGSGIELGRVVKDALGSDVLGGGRSDLSLDVKGQGASLRAVMAGLTGTTLLTVGEGRIRNGALDAAGGDLLTQVAGRLNPLGPSEGPTQLQCGVVRFVVKDGIATADKGIAVETAKVYVVGAGIVDLRSEALDIGISPRAREGIGLSVGNTVGGITRVRGTLADPSVGLDPVGVARTAASVGAAVATGGLSLLGELALEKLTADASPCQTALGKPARKAARPTVKTRIESLFGR
jgi:AsmA family protein